MSATFCPPSFFHWGESLLHLYRRRKGAISDLPELLRLIFKLLKIMKKKIYFKTLITWASALSFIVLMTGCPSPSPASGSGTTTPTTPTVAQLIAKVWTANIVKEGATIVYTKGATGHFQPK